jgi:hypothetical protein
MRYGVAAQKSLHGGPGQPSQAQLSFEHLYAPPKEKEYAYGPE